MLNQIDQTPLNKANLKPYSYPGLIRLGNRHDGGYVIPEDLMLDSSVLLSLGINDDWLFDKQFQQRNPDCKVVGVDYTVTLWFIIKKTLQYSLKTLINTVLMNKCKRDKYLTRLLNCVFFHAFFRKNNIHLKRKVAKSTRGLDIGLADLIDTYASTAAEHKIFLKMDIEGSEYEVLDELLARSENIGVIAAEFHHLHLKTDVFNDFIAKVLPQFAIVHIHGNNYGAFDKTIDFPQTVEITLVNKALMKSMEYATHHYPRKHLDFPNNPQKADYPLAFD